jgi:hypothetical protein
MQGSEVNTSNIRRCEGMMRFISTAAVFLASPAAESISGIMLCRDGGHQACCV